MSAVHDRATDVPGGPWTGLAGRRQGEPGAAGRAIVLLHGLTFDHLMWEPVLAALPPSLPVVAFDLPGHGGSPALASHRLPVVVDAVHAAVLEAGLDAPIMVGHSLGAGLAGIYAATHPAAAVVNVDAAMRLEPFARLAESLAPRLRADFPTVWAMFRESMHVELLPDDARVLLRAGEDVAPELVLGYWADLLDGRADDVLREQEEQLARVRAARVPYLGVFGRPVDPAEREWVADRLPHGQTVTWPVGHHFPHLAHPERFSALLTGLAAALPPTARETA